MIIIFPKSKLRFSEFWNMDCINKNKRNKANGRELTMKYIHFSSQKVIARKYLACALWSLSILIIVSPFVLLTWMMHACVWPDVSPQHLQLGALFSLSVSQSVVIPYLFRRHSVVWWRWVSLPLRKMKDSRATTEARGSIQIQKPHRLKTVSLVAYRQGHKQIGEEVDRVRASNDKQL